MTTARSRHMPANEDSSNDDNNNISPSHAAMRAPATTLPRRLSNLASLFAALVLVVGTWYLISDLIFLSIVIVGIRVLLTGVIRLVFRLARIDPIRVRISFDALPDY